MISEMSCRTLLYVSLLFVLSFFLAWVHSDSCEAQEKIFSPIIKEGNSLDIFYFLNDTKETIQLTWAGENSGVLILVTMTEGETGPGLTSDIYRSDNNGKTFTKITKKLGERVHIRRENGLQRHQNQRDSKELFVICYDVENEKQSIIFVTKNGGSTWERSNVPFVLSGHLRFYPRDRLAPWVLTLEDKTSNLYLSLDNGKNWKNIHSNVVDYFWSIYGSDSPETIYVLCHSNESKNESERYLLVKSSNFGQSWDQLLNNVIRVWAPRGVSMDIPELHDKTKFVFESEAEEEYDTVKFGRFLFVSHYVGSENQTVQLSVSTNGGKTFSQVYLPTIQAERFYSVLEVEEDSAFIHVDAPNDTGYGALFISDITGTIFTESLRQHLYPNHAPVTDFYRVASMRGTYLATRLNPDRTLHTVITHNRGASWSALDIPTNVPNACQTKTTHSSTTTRTTASSHLSTQTTIINQQQEQQQQNAVAHELSSILDGDISSNQLNSPPNEIWRPDPNMNDTSTPKLCGLQISNQFSIKNRVIASPPLSIASAPGLILAHGHVATHLKNTPADVFISSDGGYSWFKALEGPHHYQIANRGGLLVAVPAETLWPDILRFSTDQGRCWYTIPLRNGQWQPTTAQMNVQVNLMDLTTDENTSSNLSKILSTTQSPITEQSPNLNEESWSKAKNGETVVFTGLVTEPGGRAMAAAVYGYGTITQRWRVAVVDFETNGIVTKKCTTDDYEYWTPHSNVDKKVDGCLLGVREQFKRLKKNSICANEYKMEMRAQIEICPCTELDYECEYGFYRQPGSLNCVPNPYIPPLNPCELSEEGMEYVHQLGYRLIPGDRCIDGWKPPLLNQSIVHLAKRCPKSIMPYPYLTGMIMFMLIISIILVILYWIQCRRHPACRMNTSQHYLTCRIKPIDLSRIRLFCSPLYWKRSNIFTIPLGNSHRNNSQTVLWPPPDPISNWESNHTDLNHVNNKPDIHKIKSNIVNIKPITNKLTRPLHSHWIPTLARRLGIGKHTSDVTNLLDAEEVVITLDTSVQNSMSGKPNEIFTDPLATISAQNMKTNAERPSNGNLSKTLTHSNEI